jgi:dephospho-CoA kinase
MKVLGVTGKIASGKSMVAEIIKEIKKEASIIDVDEVAKGIYPENPGVLKELKDLFGEDIFGPKDCLVFRLLAEKVFSSKRRLMKLNKLMFPLIKKEVKGILESKSAVNYIVIDAAVLFGCGLDKFCDYIILVESPLEKRKKRLRSLSLAEDEIKLKVEGQYIEIVKDRVDFIIKNDGSRDFLFRKVKNILKNI